MGRPDSGKRRFVTKACPRCGEEFTNSDPYYPEQKYCSRTCNMRRINADPEHQAVAGAQGGKRDRPPAGPGTYLKVPGADEHAHRAAAETALGRPLAPGEVVHHEDRDKHNNDRSNLIVFPNQGWHARHHAMCYSGRLCGCPGIRLKEVMPDEAP